MHSINYSADTPTAYIERIAQVAQHFADADIHVNISPSKVQLSKAHANIPPISLSFVDAKPQKQLNNISHAQPLFKAFHFKGIKDNSTIKIIDLTAGLGQDSLMLATRGYPIISIEVNPMTAAILDILVKQYQSQHDVNWQVIQACSQSWLSQQSKPCATHLYLDPFFYKKKSALPKITMQWIHELSLQAPIQPETPLFQAAMTHASYRVIVKRDQHADFINQHKPNQGSFIQKTSRFDCYKP